MKRLSILLFLAIFAFTSNAQDLRIGLIGGVSSTWLFNKNVSDSGDDLDYASTIGGSIGVNGIYSFNESSGLSLGFIYSGHNQSYTGDLDNNFSYESKIKLSYLDIPILFRVQSESGPFLEIGPQISFLMGAKEDFELSPADPDFNYSGRDFKENFNSTNIAAILGFGFDFDASESVVITTGLRFGYGLTDVTTEFSMAEAAVLEAVDQLSYVSFASHNGHGTTFGYKASSRAFGGLFVGVSYKIP